MRIRSWLESCQHPRTLTAEESLYIARMSYSLAKRCLRCSATIACDDKQASSAFGFGEPSVALGSIG